MVLRFCRPYIDEKNFYTQRLPLPYKGGMGLGPMFTQKPLPFYPMQRPVVAHPPLHATHFSFSIKGYGGLAPMFTHRLAPFCPPKQTAALARLAHF